MWYIYCLRFFSLLFNGHSAKLFLIDFHVPGYAVSCGVSSEFEMVHLKKCPEQYNTLSELMTVFKSKIGLTSVMSGSSRVSARFTYVLNDWGENGKWPTKHPDYEALASHYGSLLCGSYEDPVGELQLACTWPSMIGDMVIDNKFHSYFKPLTAPQWSMRLCYTDDMLYLLSSYLFEFYKITDRLESMADLLNVLHDEPERDMGQALSRITDPQNAMLPMVPVKLTSGITKVVTDPQALLRKGAYTLGRIAAVRERIPKDVLFDLKSFLFFESTNDQDQSQQKLASSTFTLCHKLKAAPVNSLTYRIALCAIVVNMCHGGLSALAQLWHLLVTELRSRLDTGSLLPGVETSHPDLKTCLLHQKLQMLNCCIQCKRQRDSPKHKVVSSESCSSFKTAFTQKTGSSSSFHTMSSENMEKSKSDNFSLNSLAFSEQSLNSDTKAPDNSKSKADESLSSTNDKMSDKAQQLDARERSQSEDSDDEFFECESSVQQTPEEKNVDEIITESSEEIIEDHELTVQDQHCEVSDAAAEGRLSKCEDLKLLHFDRALYIPLTQDHAPVTEDLLEEQADVFSKLGDTQEGSRVRAKMQSASLLSDMQAFKAANPGCCLEDFVRWYSPKDFEDGKLSARMTIPSNLWVTSWASAKATPISRQKRIFDDTKEAEKVLHFLANLKPSEVAQLLVPVCTHEALVAVRLASESMADCLPSLPLICDQIESKASRLFRYWRMHGSVSNNFVAWNNETRNAVHDVFTQISFAESLIERARSLRHKFAGLGGESDVNAFVKKLLEHPEVPLEGAADGRAGSVIRAYFENQQSKRKSYKEGDSVERLGGNVVSPFPDSAGREFVIRAQHCYPTSGSRKLPHRFYAVIMKNEFRLATAVTSDTTFF